MNKEKAVKVIISVFLMILVIKYFYKGYYKNSSCFLALLISVVLNILIFTTLCDEFCEKLQWQMVEIVKVVKKNKAKNRNQLEEVNTLDIENAYESTRTER